MANKLTACFKLCIGPFGGVLSTSVGPVECLHYSPQSSHFGRAMEVAVKGKSPSYLHLFPIAALETEVASVSLVVS